jgi:hypothetical protein
MDLTFALGILSILQICFLPGILLARACRIESGLSFIVSAFGLSLFCNAVCIYLLIIFHLYQPMVVYGLIMGEIFLLWKCYGSRSVNLAIPQIIYQPRQITFADLGLDRIGKYWRYIIFALCLCAAMGAIFYFIDLWIRSWGSILFARDSYFVWNKWAKIWFHGRIPHSMHYPQLLPLNWSMSYILIQRDDIQLFMKVIMPFFILFSVLTLLDLGQRRKDVAFYIAIPVLGYLSSALIVPKNVFLEYMDVPAMFFILLGVYWLLRVEDVQSRAVIIRNVLLSSVFIASAALTKQSGLYFAVLFPVLGYVFALRYTPLLSGYQEKVRILAMGMGLILVFAGSWYVFKEFQIHRGHDRSEIQIIQGVVHEASSLEVPIRNLSKIPMGLMLLFGVALLYSLCNGFALRLFFLIILPYSMIWFLFFHYHFRLASPVFPFVAINIGLGLRQAVLGKFYPDLPQCKWQIVQKISLQHFCVVVVGIIIGLSHYYFPTPVLVQRHHDELKLILRADINKHLYSLKGVLKKNGLVLTDYRAVTELPGIKRHFIFSRRFDEQTIRHKLNQYPNIKSLLFSRSCRKFYHNGKVTLESGGTMLLNGQILSNGPVCLIRIRN